MANNARDALWASGHDESVEVNQRALIDKVLARYSGEFTVFRELLQNSDDAQATSVEIHFDTKGYLDKLKAGPQEEHGDEPGLPDLKTTLVHQWVFKNNGIKFREEDWSRLKKIAEGNPDEEKIGAFGVGFYSLFSVTEEPFVTSGDEWMGFYWKDKKDQLFARRGTLPAADSNSPWTTFEMVLRDPAPIPVAFDFTRFLASSITFMTHLREVSLFFDDKRLAHLKKTPGLPQQLDLPKGLRTASSSGMMNVKGLHLTSLHIQAQVLHWVYTSGSEKKARLAPVTKPKLGGFFSSLFTSLAGSATPQRGSTPLPDHTNVNPLDINETSVTLSVFAAEVDVKLQKKISAELYRSTKKNPPTKVRYELIYTAKDEYDKSKKEDDLHAYSTGSIFQGLRADLEGSGATRIFIGHATGQTTGLGGHMASRFIPTVERESIDLMDRNVALWNKDLLSVGGYLARAAYERELETIKLLWDGAFTPDAKVDEELQNWLRSRCIHALKFFTFHPSTPSNDISNLLEAAFFSCDTNTAFPLVSTVGVRKGSSIRLPDPAFKDFLKHLPVLPDEVLADASAMVATLQNRGMIKNITFDDVLQELRARPLNADEMVACLKWWITLSKQSDRLRQGPRTQFLDAAILVMEKTEKSEEKIIPLSSIRSFINTKSIANIIPLDGPLPDHLFPTSVSKNVPSEDLSSAFPWNELTILQWLQHICQPSVRKSKTDYDITVSAAWAERVLSIIARAWTNLSQPSRNEIQACLKNLACIPTSSGMKVPEQAYFAQANIFNDLPVVTFPSGATPKGQLEKVLQAMGVRRHVELQVIFSRMIKTNEWTVADLVKYLVSVESTLSDDERSRLKVTAAFFKEGESDSEDKKPTRYQAQQLYEPSDVLRQLGLPILDWGKQHKWRSTSDEARFLFDQLGLKRHPPLPVLINICASSDVKIRTHALKYLLDHMHTHYKDYDPSKFGETAFIPAVKGTETCLGTLKEVVWNQDWAIFDFLVTSPSLPPDAIAKLKIPQHPASHRIVDLLEKRPPSTETEARTWFSILSARISDFSSTELQRLSNMKIVPVRDKKEDKIQWHVPSKCYLGGDTPMKFHSKLFVFVNFGQPANGFLTACGTKHEPSVDEVALALLDNPHEFYESAQGPTQFLSELRNLAVNQRMIKSATISRMKTAPILLGSRRKVKKRSEKVELDDYEDDYELEYDLKKPSEIIIADDTHALQAFGDSLFIAPQEDILEAFYIDLGSKRLSALVVEEYQTTSEIRESKTAQDVRALVLERLPLFLHEHSHARTRVTYSWLTSPDNFTVRSYGKLTINKSLTFGELKLSRKQDASAVARRPSRYGAIELAIAGNAQIDMYEVALCLNRLIFESPRANDALLFMTILSTDLKALKRRGYNVDRILRQQQAQKAAEAAKKAEKAELLSKPQYGDLDSPTLTPTPPEKDSSQGTNSPVKRPVPLPATNSIKNSLKLFSRKPSLAPELPPVIPPPTAGGPSNEAKPSTVTKGTRPTPLSNIASNIDMAVKACRPESGNLLRNREEMRQIRESLNEGYCDISGRIGDLNRVGEVGKVKIYLSYDVPEQKDFVTIHKDSISRFVYLVTRLARIYDIPLTSMHIFYDLGGTLIAFNRNGSIFLNLRYFQEWHDSDVLAGNLNTAYISWYFTLAHEIAHNLVQPHNSEHEFYFSAICEKHLMNLGQLLSA